ncbi:MAG: DUF2000 domain-containing protein [Bacillota bacterium]
MKCVMIIDKELPIGLIANTAAVLGMSLGQGIEGIIGPDVTDKDQVVHKGITNVPIPILSSEKDRIKEIYDRLRAENNEEILIIDFNAIAQKSKSYDDYIEKISNAESDALNYLGICVYGPKKAVNKVCGSIGTLK